MLNREKILIEMLRQARRPVAKLELVKWAFILRQETDSAGGASFYDFVPYHYGPYSFALAREIESMAAIGFVREEHASWTPGNHLGESFSLPESIARDTVRVVSRLVKKSIDDLLKYVYHSYPDFTVNSKRAKLASRPVADPQVYTAGYEGLQVDAFLNLLVQHGIERLVDVRRNPVARRYGFHKSTLRRLCGLIDIEYEHVPELGIASVERKDLKTESDYSALFDRYVRTTLVAEHEAVERVARLVVEKPSVLVCMEADHRSCHRSRLAVGVAGETGLPIVHLEPLS